MVSSDLRGLARTINKIISEEKRLPTLNECDSIALNLHSIARRVEVMEDAAIPPSKRVLTIINGGKNREAL